MDKKINNIAHMPTINKKKKNTIALGKLLVILVTTIIKYNVYLKTTLVTYN